MHTFYSVGQFKLPSVHKGLISTKLLEKAELDARLSG